MPLFSKSYLTNLSNSYSLSAQQRVMNERVTHSTAFDIFLSHSFLDRKEVLGIYVALTRMGFSVYVDWIIDSHLDRTKVTKETAELVRKRLESSKSLLLAVSSNAQLSKWVPWELGVVDGHTKKCSLFPVSTSTSETKFERSEYLLLYPYIKLADLDTSSDNMYIMESSNYYTDFKGWQNETRPISYKARNIDYL